MQNDYTDVSMISIRCILQLWDCFLCGYSNLDDAAAFCARCGTLSYAVSTTSSNATSGNYSMWLYKELKGKGYPDKEMTVLRESVEDFKRHQPFAWKIIDDTVRQGELATLAYARERQRHSRASEIVNQMTLANDLFQDRRKAKLFRLDMAGILEKLHNPCVDADDFAAKIASLASLFEVPLDPLRLLVPNSQSEWKAIKLVEEILESEKIRFDPDMIKTRQNIIDLRNAMPLHARDRPIPALEFFGATFPIGYEQLWDNVLDKFLYSLKKFVEVLASL